MLILLSPAKTLDVQTPTRVGPTTQPRFLEHTESLVRTARRQSARKLGELMSISPALATLNRDRFRDWCIEHDDQRARPAIQAFRGDVYTGLDADTLDGDDLAFAQDRLRILSGLYGVLRPLDLMHAHRLEMGTRLPTRRGRTLYDFWGARLAAALDEEANGEPIVNLASNEYYEVIGRPGAASTVVSPVFQDEKGGSYKIISFFAKRARGAMARHLIRSRAGTTARTLDEALTGFDSLGYRYVESESSETVPVFRRSERAAAPWLAAKLRPAVNSG